MVTRGGDETGLSEIGWMVLPAYQGQGLAKRAVRTLLERACDDGRWGVVHAFPGVTIAASNALCRCVGFTLVGEREVRFAGRLLHTSHWRIDPSSDLVSVTSGRNNSSALRHVSEPGSGI